MKLNLAKQNKSYKIQKIEYNIPLIANRLTDLGVVELANITVIREGKNNACLIILVNERLVAVSNEIASKIDVTLNGNGNE